MRQTEVTRCDLPQATVPVFAGNPKFQYGPAGFRRAILASSRILTRCPSRKSPDQQEGMGSNA